MSSIYSISENYVTRNDLRYFVNLITLQNIPAYNEAFYGFNVYTFQLVFNHK